MRDKKYLVIGGKVISKTDGQRHYVSAVRLCELYKLNPVDCYLAEEKCSPSLHGLPSGLPILRPRKDGNYSLEEASK